MARDIDTSGRIGTTDRRRLKAQAKASDDMLADIYEQGRQEGRREARKPSPSSARRRHRPSAPKTAKTAARQLAQPVRSQLISGWKFLGLVLLVIALYHLLRFAEQAPDTFKTFVAGPSRALQWLADPHKSIPLKGGK